MRLPLPLAALLLALATLTTTSCGRSAEALNSQGYRALAFGAHIDAGYYFQFAEDLIGEEGVPEGADEHPELQRLIVGQRVVALFPQRDAPPADDRDRELDDQVFAKGFAELLGAIAERGPRWRAEDFAFVVEQLIEEARRPAEAARVLELGLAAWPGDSRLEDLAEGLDPLPSAVEAAPVTPGNSEVSNSESTTSESGDQPGDR